MYLPKQYAMLERNWIERVAKENPLATVISVENNVPYVSHLPLLWKTGANGNTKLLGHLARSNTHWKILEQTKNVYVIFHGPQDFISPTWYEQNDVPTWNYIVVHIHGTLRFVHTYPELDQILRETAIIFEAESPNAWNYELPDDLSDSSIVMRAIAGFEIDVHKIEAKFKISQNRSDEDQRRVIAGLRERNHPRGLELAAWMEKLLN